MRRHLRTCSAGLVAALAVIVAGACTPAGHGPSSETSSLPVSTSTKWDPASRRPPLAVTPRRMTDAEKRRARETLLAEALDSYELPRDTPLPSLVRWVLPEESGYVIAVCMTDEGFPMVGEPNGSSRYTGSNADKWTSSKRARLALVRCTARYTIDPRVGAPMTESTLQAMWYYYHDYGIPCLGERRFSPDSPLPTLSDYVASQGQWTFYPTAEDPNHLLTVQDYAVCPEVPWKVLLGP